MNPKGTLTAFPTSSGFPNIGLTKRELFAAIAMHALIQKPAYQNGEEDLAEKAEGAAATALEFADALVTALATAEAADDHP